MKKNERTDGKEGSDKKNAYKSSKRGKIAETNTNTAPINGGPTLSVKDRPGVAGKVASTGYDRRGGGTGWPASASLAKTLVSSVSKEPVPVSKSFGFSCNIEPAGQQETKKGDKK